MTEMAATAAQAVRAGRDRMAQAAVKRFLAQGGFADRPMDARAHERCVADAMAHLDAVATALERGRIAELEEYAAWTGAFLRGLGIGSQDLAGMLGALEAEVASELEDEDAAPATAALQRARVRLEETPLVEPAELARIDRVDASGAGTLAAALDAAGDYIAQLTVCLSYARRPQDAIAHGDRRFRCLEDARYHVGQLREAALAGAPELFADYCTWGQIVLTGLGLDGDELLSHVRTLREMAAMVLPEAVAGPALACLEAGVARLSEPPRDVPSFIDADHALSGLAQEYLTALIAGDRRKASRLVLDAVKGGAEVRDVYIGVLQPVQYEVGRLWQLNQISVAQEHFCTAATQMVMSQLYAWVFSEEQHGHRIVATCVGGNMHEIGVRFVADFFEMAGWETYYLGANTPTEHVVREVHERKADVLAISATLNGHLKTVRRLIAAVRADARTKDTLVLVGGYPFRAVPTLWKELGADGSATEAAAAVEVANRLVAARS